jgi:hypothetical protein
VTPEQAIERLWQLSEGDERFNEPLLTLEAAFPLSLPKQDLQAPQACQMERVGDNFVWDDSCDSCGGGIWKRVDG